MELFAGIVIGFLGSFHCIGMCGPIALALPIPKSSNISFVTGRIFYNVGRALTYSVMGAVFGLLGGRIIFSGFQQALSISLGILILSIIFLPSQYKRKFISLSIIQKINQPLRQAIGILFKQGTFSSLFLIGVLNGFLPCGFVYIGLAGAAATGDAVSGGAFMFLFGLGTFPAMFAASVFGKFINLNVRQKIRKLMPAFAVMLAVIFILRGMNLGIPYVSPNLNARTNTSENLDCHY